MEREGFPKALLIIFTIILVFALVFLFLNLDNIFKIHSGFVLLWVTIYTTYSFLKFRGEYNKNKKLF
ncbi:MAG: hypothetical protein ACFE9P_09045 [Candidatus Hermodarchaeota archaeon]